MAVAGAQALGAQSAREASLTGCWQASRPLGPTGTTQALEREAGFVTFILRNGGRVSLPRLEIRQRQRWEERSYWNVVGDSVTLQAFTGLQGWLATLVQSANGRSLTGRATYLSDAIVAGAKPLGVLVTLTRVVCEPGWPAVDTIAGALRPWQRGEYVHFAGRVDTRAAVLRGTSLPRGVVAVRELGDEEHSRLDPPEPGASVGRVVLQVVIEKDGRAYATSAKVLATDGEPFTARALDALGQLRFFPARREGSSVHQLAALRMEVRRGSR